MLMLRRVSGCLQKSVLLYIYILYFDCARFLYNHHYGNKEPRNCQKLKKKLTTAFFASRFEKIDFGCSVIFAQNKKKVEYALTPVQVFPFPGTASFSDSEVERSDIVSPLSVRAAQAWRGPAVIFVHFFFFSIQVFVF